MDVQDARSSTARRGYRLLLPDHHRRLDAQCHALVARADAGEHELGPAWRRFEAELLEHFAAEEQHVLPSYAQHAPEDAGRLRDEHARIRALIAPIGLDIELRRPCAALLRVVSQALAAHAAREDALLYPWAQHHLPDDSQRSLFERLVALWFDRPMTA